ncbi:hypothetical protein AAKU52_001999 [Pedobacter sp. CG_S7]|uniref:head GIN domain-containing protein n=1 Tax=Pedobacter sp. CG_S7 TaxID=3143930 RepID=UPI0033949966
MSKSISLKPFATLILLLLGYVITAFGQQTKTVMVQNVNEINVSSDIDLYLSQGNTESVKIMTSGELLKNVLIEKNGTQLTIKYKDNVSWELIFRGQKIKAYVSYKSLYAISASGGSDVYTQNTIKTPRLNINASGGSDMRLDLMTQDLQVQASGGADVDLKGKATNMSIHSSGGSDINAFNFIVENARVKSSGGSDVQIHVTKALEASASGGSDITFKGNASLKNNSSKSGEVKSVR